MAALKELILTRKSVRTYDGKGLTPEDVQKIEEYMSNIPNPFGVPVTFRLLEGEKYGLSSPVLVGEKLYAAGIVPKVPKADEAYGYSFEKLVLYAWSLGIGTVWIGGTMNRDAFEKAAGITSEERMPCMTPLGYPAAKKSVREGLMRKGVKADSRMPMEELFFDETFGNPIRVSKDDPAYDLLEMVRWAPSAVNKQPWRIVRKDGIYHFFEKKDKGYVSEACGDLQRIDVGIGLCHFVSGAEEAGLKVEVFDADPGIHLPDNTDYIVSVRF